MTLPESFQKLIHLLGRLPGVGRRSAERMAYRVATDRKGLGRELAQALQAVAEEVVMCSRCGKLTVRDCDPCSICADSGRDAHLLCVVEDSAGIDKLETAGGYRGRYHCLMGKLSPMQGQDIPPARVRQLVDRVRQEGVREVILAFDTDVESDATTRYVQEKLTDAGVRVSRLAFGLPAGSGIAYSDPVTLARALDGRQPPA